MHDYIVKKESIVTKIRKKWYGSAASSSILESIDVDNFLNKLRTMREPLTAYERAYFQYKITDEYLDKRYILKSNLIFFVGLPILAGILVLRRKKMSVEKKDAVFYKISGNLGIIPQSLNNKYRIEEKEPSLTMRMCPEIKKFLSIVLKRKWLAPTFVFKVIYALGNYAYIEKKYHPEVIITSYESSFSSSVLTEFCEHRGIKHINVMHGEKILSPYQSFSAFTECYVWDEHYIKLFNKSRMRIGKYIVDNPWTKLELSEKVNRKKADYVFYLNCLSDSEMQRLAENVRKLKGRGVYIRVRPHPVQQNMNEMEQLIGSICEIEYPKDVDILCSLASTDSAVSQYSTVLYQAYCLNKKVVIDDLTNEKLFKQLQKLDYIMLAKPHVLLSALVNETSYEKLSIN